MIRTRGPFHEIFVAKFYLFVLHIEQQYVGYLEVLNQWLNKTMETKKKKTVKYYTLLYVDHVLFLYILTLKCLNCFRDLISLFNTNTVLIRPGWMLNSDFFLEPIFNSVCARAVYIYERYKPYTITHCCCNCRWTHLKIYYLKSKENNRGENNIVLAWGARTYMLLFIIIQYIHVHVETKHPYCNEETVLYLQIIHWSLDRRLSCTAFIYFFWFQIKTW